MSADGRVGLGAAEVILITSKLEKDDTAFIIGGQATNLWAWFYRNRDPTLAISLTSQDIDYFGPKVRGGLPTPLAGICYCPSQEASRQALRS